MIDRIVGIRARARAPLAAALAPVIAAVLAGCGAYDSTASPDGVSSVGAARSTPDVPDPRVQASPPAQGSPASQESNLPEIVVTARAPRANEREAMARKARAANGAANETG